MDNKIKVLTDKILNEGVERGKEQARQLLADAQNKAEKTITDAHLEAEKIISDAKRISIEQKKNTESELRLAVIQSLQSVKSAIVDSIADRLSIKAIADVNKNPDFLPSMLIKIIEKWNPEKQLEIETSDAETLLEYFQNNAKDLLDKGIEIRHVEGCHKGFSIMPKDAGYKIAFGEEELITFFKSFLRPHLVEQLFD